MGEGETEGEREGWGERGTEGRKDEMGGTEGDKEEKGARN